jgi:hypothetical protein
VGGRFISEVLTKRWNCGGWLKRFSSTQFRGYALSREIAMTTILIIVLLIVLFGGGGFYGRGRWW